MKRFKSIVVAAFAVLVSVAGYAPLASADSASLSIVPKKNYVIEPGKSVQDKLTVRNLDTISPLHLSLRVVDFTFTDDSGTPKLMLAEDAPQTSWSLRPFLKVPQNVTIAPGSSETLDMSVSIPAGHGAGSYYSAIIYSSTSGQGGNVGLSASGVTLVFTQIPGKVNENLQLKKFGAYDVATKSFMFVTTKKPESMAYTLKNNGNVTEGPVGQITLKHMFIGKEQTITDLNPAGSLALIGQTRTFTACIKLKDEGVNLNGERSTSRVCDTPTLWPGRYTATIDLFYGQNGNMTQEIVKTVTFWYLPLWFLIPFVLLLLVAAYYIWRLVRAVRGTTGDGRRKMPSRR
jgi:hypothetical protein